MTFFNLDEHSRLSTQNKMKRDWKGKQKIIPLVQVISKTEEDVMK